MDELKTEEEKRKFPVKKILFLILCIILICGVVFAVIFLYNKVKNNKKEKVEKKEENIVTLNSELDTTYAFAKEGDYLVAIKKDKTNKKVYNLSQGTGNLGEFLDYTYYDKKLYLLFGTNNIYSISLTEGNGVYELQNEYNYLPATCYDEGVGKTSNIVVNDKIIYFNNSNCCLTGINYITNKEQVNLKVFNNVGYSSLVYSNSKKTLYMQADNVIYELDEKNEKKLIKILDNANGDRDLKIYDNILLYTTKGNNGLYNYFGYNIDTQVHSLIKLDVNKLVEANKKYYYLKDNKIYEYNGKEDKEIYTSLYDTLMDLELIDNNTIQVVVTNNTNNKEKIINIDLSSNKYKSKEVSDKYDSLRLVK